MYYTKLGKLFGNVPFIFKANGTNAWFPGQIAVALMTACVLKRFERHRTAGCGQGYYLYAVWKTWPGQFWGGQCVEFPDCVTRVIRLTKLRLGGGEKKFFCLFVFKGEKSSLLEATSSAGCSIPNRETLFQKVGSINKPRRRLGEGAEAAQLHRGLCPPACDNWMLLETRVCRHKDVTVFQTNCIFNYDVLKKKWNLEKLVCWGF